MSPAAHVPAVYMSVLPAVTVESGGATPDVPDSATTCGSPRHTGMVGLGVGVGAPERVGVGRGVPVLLAAGVPVALLEPVADWLPVPVPLAVRVAVAAAVLVRVGEGVDVEERVPVLVLVSVFVGVTVPDALAVNDDVGVGVSDADADDEGVVVGEVLSEPVPVVEPDTLTETVAVPLAVRVGLLERVPVELNEGIPVELSVVVAVRDPLLEVERVALVELVPAVLGDPVPSPLAVNVSDICAEALRSASSRTRLLRLSVMSSLPPSTTTPDG